MKTVITLLKFILTLRPTENDTNCYGDPAKQKFCFPRNFVAKEAMTFKLPSKVLNLALKGS